MPASLPKADEGDGPQIGSCSFQPDRKPSKKVLDLHLFLAFKQPQN